MSHLIVGLYTLILPSLADGEHSSDLTSSRWVYAVRLNNYQALVLALFAIIFSTKDQAISRLFIGSFLMTFWLTVIPLNELHSRIDRVT